MTPWRRRMLRDIGEGVAIGVIGFGFTLLLIGLGASFYGATLLAAAGMAEALRPRGTA